MVNSTYLGVCNVEDQPTDPISICVATMYILFGIVYTLFGYRCFKAVMFLTGFIFASVIVYLICIQEQLLPAYANTGISLMGGLLFGLITMLVQYVGLFMTGFHTGLGLALAALVLTDQLYTPPSLLTSVSCLLGIGLLFAILNLHWRRGLTILGTCVVGGALLTFSVDYLSELSRTVKWLWKRQGLPCYPILALWPTAVFLGLAVQLCFTVPPPHHHVSARISAKKQSPEVWPNLHGTPGKHGRGRTREQRAELRQNKYRYLYQVRTAHGDVISQNYVQALQNKVIGPGETSTLESDATHLTMLPDGQTELGGRAGGYYR